MHVYDGKAPMQIFEQAYLAFDTHKYGLWAMLKMGNWSMNDTN